MIKLTLIEKIDQHPDKSSDHYKELINEWYRENKDKSGLKKLQGVGVPEKKSKVHYRIRTCYYCNLKTRHIYTGEVYRCTKHNSVK